MARFFLALLFVASPVYATTYFSSPEYPVKASLLEAEHLQYLLSHAKNLDHEEWGSLWNLAKRIPGFEHKEKGETVTDEDTIREVMRWMQVPPCDPLRFNRSVTVVLSGEDHRQPPVRDVRRMLTDAKEGRVLTILEGGIHNLKRSDPLTNVVKSDADGREANELSVAIDALVTTMGRNEHPFTKLAGVGAQRVLRSSTSASFREFASDLEGLIQANETNNDRAIVAASRRIIAAYRNFSRGDRIAMLDEVSWSRLRALTTTRGKFRDIAPTIDLPKVIEEQRRVLASGHAFSEDYFDQFWKFFALDFRDRNLAHSATEAICEASRRGIRKVHVHMGLAHLAGVYDILDKTFARQDSGRETVRVVVDDSQMRIERQRHITGPLARSVARFYRVVDERDLIRDPFSEPASRAQRICPPTRRWVRSDECLR